MNSFRFFLAAIAAAASVPGIISRAAAQAAVEKETSAGMWRLTLEPVKTTYIGTFGRYAGPEIAHAWHNLWNGNASPQTATSPSPSVKKKRPSVLRILLPSGRLPRDMKLHYAGASGYRASFAYEPNWIKLWNGLSPRISVSMMFDSNKLRANAPTGIGILTDPTKGAGRAEFRAFSAEIGLPLYRLEGGHGAFTFYAGSGWMVAKTKTLGTANSAFLRLAIPESQKLMTPTFSFTGEYRPASAVSFLDVGEVLKFSGISAGLFTFRSQGMWTLGASAGLIWRL